MWAGPVYMPQFSNREDFVYTASIFDVDTGDPINLGGIIKQLPGDFTASAWMVRDGAIVTTSATTITINDYPITGQLSTLALTVGAGLGILAGDPITITDTATAQNQMFGYVISYAAATGALVVQIGVQFTFEIRPLDPGNEGPRASSNWDYGTDFGYGFGAQGGTWDTPPVIAAALGSGIAIIDLGYYQINIPESSMRQLKAKTYQASLVISDSVNTRQVFIARLPMLPGGVTN